MKRLLEKSKGITLIALVVTIVVLLILAGVSISMLTGENGIITQAQKSKNKTEIGKVKEAISIIENEYMLDNDLKKPTSRYIIEKLIEKKEIKESQVKEYGDVTGIGIINVANEDITIIGNIEDLELAMRYEVEGNLIRLYPKIKGSNTYGDYATNIIYGKTNEELGEEFVNGYNYWNEVEGGGDPTFNSLSDFAQYIYEQGQTSKVCANIEEIANVWSYNSARVMLINEALIQPQSYNFEQEEVEKYFSIACDGATITENQSTSMPYVEYNITYGGTYEFSLEAEGKSISIEIEITEGDNYGGIYSVGVLDIAPVEIFDYEIISDAETSDLSMDKLPTKTVKITRIKPEYCNGQGYNPDTSTKNLTDTNYEIRYNGQSLTDILVIPYQVEGKYVEGGEEGEYYKIAEVNISVFGKIDTRPVAQLPNVETIIFPNTVKKIDGNNNGAVNDVLKTVILPNGLTEINEYLFYGCYNLTGIKIPESVTNIGKMAFSYCTSLTDITIPKSVTSVGEEIFGTCSNLININVDNNNTVYDSRNNCNAIIEKSTNTLIAGCKNSIIPNSVTSIGDRAFYECTGLTSIVIPSNVTSIGNGAFFNCTGLTSITIPSSVTSIRNEAFLYCKNLTTVNYTGTEEQWNAITIGSSNDYLTNATINYNYTGQ